MSGRRAFVTTRVVRAGPLRRLARLRGARPVLVAAVLFAAAAAVYASTVLVWHAVSGGGMRPALWVLLVAALFVSPLVFRLRPHVEVLVDTLAFGEQADAYAAMTRFVGRLASTLDVDDVLPRVAETAARSVHGSRGEVCLWLADGREWREVWQLEGVGTRLGDARLGDEKGGDVVAVSVPVAHKGDAVGEIGVDTSGWALASEQARILSELARPAGLAMSTVRLTVELRRRIDETMAVADQIERSRQRLVEARRHEQARIASDVRDVVRPHLDAAEGALGALADRLASDPTRRAVIGPGSGGPPASELLAGARNETLLALESLRTIARGIFPAILADAGLERALRSWVGLTGSPAVVSCAGEPARLRDHPSVEAAVYLCCVAALGVSSSRPTAPPLGVPEEPRRAVGADEGDRRPSATIEVSSGAVRISLDPSSDLQAAANVVDTMRDRVEALGGSVLVASEPGEAEVLSVYIPLDEASGEVGARLGGHRDGSAP